MTRIRLCAIIQQHRRGLMLVKRAFENCYQLCCCDVFRYANSRGSSNIKSSPTTNCCCHSSRSPRNPSVSNVCSEALVCIAPRQLGISKLTELGVMDNSLVTFRMSNSEWYCLRYEANPNIQDQRKPELLFPLGNLIVSEIRCC